MRAILVTGALLLLLTAAACGPSTRAGGNEDAPTNTSPRKPPPPPDESSGIGWSTLMIREEPAAADKTPLVKQLAALQTPAKPEDILPQPAMDDRMGYDDVPEKFRPGRELPSQSRLLVASSDLERVSLYGVPSEKGWVCAHLIDAKDDFPGGSTGDCVQGLWAEGIYLWMSGTDEDYQVYGLAANDVRRVVLVANGKQHRAVVGRNGFVYEGRPNHVCPLDVDFMVVESRAETHRIDLNEPGIGSAAIQSDRRQYGCR